MAADEPRTLYYQLRVHLVSLVHQRDRILQGLQWMADHGKDGAFRATQDRESLGQLEQLTAEIAATTKLVNEYADLIGSPRVADVVTKN